MPTDTWMRTSRLEKLQFSTSWVMRFSFGIRCSLPSRVMTETARIPILLTHPKLPPTAITSPGLIERSITGSVPRSDRSEEHTSELQSLMRISYAVFCLKQKTKNLRDTIIRQSKENNQS